MENNRTRIYARVSSDRQRTDGTISNQIGGNVTRDILRQGLQLTGVYTDDGKSASAGKLHLRGDFQRALADAERRDYDVLWVADLDRITRSNDWKELGEIFGTLQRAGIKLAGPSLPPMELGTTMSFMQVCMRVMIAYEDNQKRCERFMIGKRATALRGAHVQGPTPYGLIYVPNRNRDGSGWQLDEGKAALVREAYERAVEGESGDSIAKDFEQRKIPGPGAGVKRGPMGGRWAEAIIRILRSPAYRGIHRWNDIVIPVPRIVTDETWFQAQAMLGESKKKGIGKPLNLYLCHQVAACVCGAPIYVKYGAAQGETIRKYVCRNATHRRPVGVPKCNLPSHRQEQMDAMIWGKVAAYLAQPPASILADLRGHAANQVAEVKAWASDVEKYTGQLADIEQREKVIMELIMSGVVDPSAGKQRLMDNAALRTKLQEQLKTAKAAVDGADSSVTVARDLERQVEQLVEMAEKADERQRRDLVRALVAKGGITFDAHGCNIRLAFGRGEDGGKADLPEITQGNCDGSMVKKPSQLPSLNVVTLRVVTGV